MTRVAAFDCGTNSIRLLIADSTPTGLHDVVRQTRITRLGRDVDRTGRFDPDALERSLEVISEYSDICDANGVDHMRFVATSATRDARNRGEFVAGVRGLLGIEPEVISGEEEADLSFMGAVSALRPHPVGDILVADLGGGSTELVRGALAPVAAYSMNIGSVRMTERHLVSDPPSNTEIVAARGDIRAALDSACAKVDVGAARTLVGVAGTVTTVTAHALHLAHYDRDAINGAVISVADALRSCRELTAMPREALAALPYMHPGRVDVMAAGALIWSEVIERVQAETARAGHEIETVTTSEHDILDGIARALVQRVS